MTYPSDNTYPSSTTYPGDSMTPPTPTTVSSVQAMGLASLHSELTTRIQRLHIFRAPMTAPIPAAITAMSASSTVELLELDEDDGWRDMGLIGSDDAPTWDRDMSTENLMAIGFRDAVRTEITEDVQTLTATFLERSRQVLETFENIDFTGNVPTADTGELRWVRPQDAPLIQARYGAYGQDGAGTDRVWIAKFLPCGVLDSVDSQQWGGDGFTTYPVTLRGNVDTALGTSLVTFMGGPGVKKNLDAMGFGETP